MEKAIEKQAKPTRDKNLDLYRGMTMLYIVAFIHTASAIFIDWHRDIWATFMLLEMPIIFYIAGAAYTLSSKKPYGKYLVGRVKRIVIPLLIYLLAYCIGYCVSMQTEIQEIPRLFISYVTKVASGRHGGLTHLWFIQPYFIIALLFPLLLYISKIANRYFIYLLLLATMVALYFYPNYVLCYLVPTFAGLYYMNDKPYNRYIILLIMLCSIIFCHYNGYPWDMQYNKFPSNLMFLSYTSAAIIVLNTPLMWCCRQLTRIKWIHYIITRYAKHDFTIYLYHTHFISITCYAYSVLCSYIPIITHPAIAYIFVATIVTVGMIPLAKVIDVINDKTTLLFSHLYDLLRNKLSGKKA